MQRCPTAGPGSQWPPCGNGSPEQFPHWVRVQHCKGGKDGERRGGVEGIIVGRSGSGNGRRVCPEVELGGECSVSGIGSGHVGRNGRDL